MYYIVNYETLETTMIIFNHQIPHVLLRSFENSSYDLCIEEEHASFAILCGLTLTEYNKKLFSIEDKNQLFELVDRNWEFICKYAR